MNRNAPSSVLTVLVKAMAVLLLFNMVRIWHFNSSTFNNSIVGKRNQLSSYMIFVCKKTPQEFLCCRVRWSLAAAKSMKQQVNSSCGDAVQRSVFRKMPAG